MSFVKIGSLFIEILAILTKKRCSKTISKKEQKRGIKIILISKGYKKKKTIFRCLVCFDSPCTISRHNRAVTNAI